MKVPVSWLREYVDFDWPVEELARRLVFSSAEVDRIVRRGVPGGPNLEYFVVGKVLEADKHPNADKLQLTRVDVGDGEPRSIVCGAWNFGAGATVAVVLPGATMPGGELRIEKRKLRGEVSDGMILSERELELGENHAGIMVLDDALQAGTPLVDVLPLGDDVLEVETLYNRPDLTSIYGIAREVAVLTGGELKPMPGSDPLVGDEPVEIAVEDLVGCPRYIGRLFRDVTIGESPAWLKARLVAAGMRPISNVVDVTNYVMLALGNPLHAFDYDSLAGGRIVVRRARPGETLETLDGTKRELSPDDLVIADAERPIGIGGVMGGANTEVGDATKTILLEAANFEPLTVLRSGERHRMRTESQTRWEKGVDPELAAAAATYASELLVGLTGARWVGSGETRAQPTPRAPIAFRPRTPTPRSVSRSAKTSSATGSNGSASVSTRTGRCIRRAGAPAMFAATSISSRRSRASGSRTCRRRCRSGRRCSVGSRTSSGCAGRSRTCSSAPASSRRTRTRYRRTIPIRTRSSCRCRSRRSSACCARRCAWGCSRRRATTSRWATATSSCSRSHTSTCRPREFPTSAGASAESSRAVSAAAKGIVELVFESLHVEPRFERAQPFAAAAVGASVQSGWVAQYGPLDLDGEWSAFELDLADLFALVPERILYRDVITYPPLRLDLAFVVDDHVPVGDLLDAARSAAGEELREARFLSDYRGDQIAPGKKSVALGFAFQSSERTLADEDGARLREAIVRALSKQFGAELRAA